MQYGFRLAHVLEERGIPLRGFIAKVCKHTSLERHQVSNILRNKAQLVSLDVISQLCEYLIDHHDVDAATLPGALFGRDPESFDALLTTPRDIHVYCGMRRSGAFEWVMAFDSRLYGTLLQEMSDVCHRIGTPAPFFHQHLVLAYGKETEKEENGDGMKAILDACRKEYAKFDKNSTDKAVVALGSMKSNPVMELLVARAFKVNPFEEDKAQTPGERKIPFAFVFRDEDVNLPSCCGGKQLTLRGKKARPGIWYEKEDGEWECCPRDETHDAALVFYVSKPGHQHVQMALSGFSGLGTLHLELVLRKRQRELWPPQVTIGQKTYGAFIVKFRFPTEGEEVPEAAAATDIIRLDDTVMRRRLEEAGTKEK